MRGTILNTGTVAGGALIGLAAGRFIPESLRNVAIDGLGLVVCLIGVQMFLQCKNVIVVVGSITVGGLIGVLLRIDPSLNAFADWTHAQLGGGGNFKEALITTSVLYCVGPMTLLGCLQDGMEGKIDLLAIKSTLDGIGSIFFAAALGAGVLVTAVVVFAVQGALTLGARQLRHFVKDEAMVGEMTATGGVLVFAMGLGLLKLTKIATATYIPALLIAPILAGPLQTAIRRLGRETR